MGVFMCLLALPRAQLCIWEVRFTILFSPDLKAKEGHLEDRLSWGQARGTGVGFIQ